MKQGQGCWALATEVCGPSAKYEDVFASELHTDKNKCSQLSKGDTLNYNCEYIRYGVCTKKDSVFSLPVDPNAKKCHAPEDCGTAQDWQCNPQDWFLESTADILSQELRYDNTSKDFSVKVAPAYEACCMSHDKSEIWTSQCFAPGSSKMCTSPPNRTAAPGSTSPPEWAPTPISEIASYLSEGVMDACVLKDGTYTLCSRHTGHPSEKIVSDVDVLLKYLEEQRQ